MIVTISLIIVATFLIGQNEAYYWLYINPWIRLADFSLGIALFLWIKSGKIPFKKYTDTKKELYAIGCFLVFFLLQPYVHANFKLSIYYWIPIVYIIAIFAHSKGKISQFLSGKIWVYLGHLSFSFYLLHHSVLKYYHKYIMPEIPSIGTGVAIFSILLISIFTSYSTYAYIEEPLRKKIRKKTSIHSFSR